MNARNALGAVGLVLPLLVWFRIVSWYVLRAPQRAGGQGRRGALPTWVEALKCAVLLALWGATVGLFLAARRLGPALTLFAPIDVP